MTAKQRLEATLWDIANTLRGKMAADDFRDYILGFIFYKYLSEKMHRYADDVLKPDKLTYNDLDEDSKKGKEYINAIRELSLDKLGYFLLPSELFSTMVKRSNAEGKANFILDDLTKVLNSISDSTRGTESEEDFANLFEDLDLTSSKLGKSEDDKNKLVVRVLAHLDGIDFELDNPSHDVLGDAYEYLIGQFASGAGKKAGEFYTPQEVSTVLARIVTTGKKRLKSVYDPTCGSGSLLLRVAKEVLDVGQFYGQEMNPTTYNLCRMNMIMHDVHYRRFDIKNEDTLERPQHADMQFEAVVANPPFSQKWKADPLKMNDPRFGAYGKLAPKTKADFAFVQHMVSSLSNEGTLACVLPHGVLYRISNELHIRKHLIHELNYIDAVIGLPANIFYGTPTAACIIVLKKQREHKKNILFIDASQYFVKSATKNRLRNTDIEKIVHTYRNRVVEERYSRIVDFEEIEKHGFNLNITRYVDRFEEPVQTDIAGASSALAELRSLQVESERILETCCAELGLPVPTASNLGLLKEYKTAAIRKIFGQDVRFRDSDGHQFPTWSESTMGDLYSQHPTNSLAWDSLNPTEGSVRNIHYGDIHTKFSALFDANLEEVPFISPDVPLTSARDRNYLREGDIVVADASEDYNDVGKAIEIHATHGMKILAGLHTMLLRPKKGAIAPGVCAYAMQSWEMRHAIMRLAQGSKVLGISWPHLKAVKIPLPKYEEQEKIVRFLSALDQQLNTLEKRIDANTVSQRAQTTRMLA